MANSVLIRRKGARSSETDSLGVAQMECSRALQDSATSRLNRIAKCVAECKLSLRLSTSTPDGSSWVFYRQGSLSLKLKSAEANAVVVHTDSPTC